MSDLTRYVHEQTRRRGYTEGWTENQFIARQLLLLIAEAAELAEHIDIGGLPLVQIKVGQTNIGLSFPHALSIIGGYADEIFKHKELWDRLDCFISNHEAARTEAADCAIVAMNALAALRGDDNDIRLKASNDVERGTRYTEPLPTRPRAKDGIKDWRG